MNSNRCNASKGARLALVGLLLAAAGGSAPAYAQPWLPDRAYREGPGIRTGNLEVHPGVAVRGGYDSNVFRADGEERVVVVDGQPRDLTQERVGSAVLAVTPHVHLSTLSEQRQTQGEDRAGGERPLPVVAFRGGAAATYFHFFAENAPKNLEVDTDLWLGILPQRPFNIDLTVAYARMVRPFTQNAYNRNAYNFHTLNPRVRLNFGSRSGVLTAYVGYSPRLTMFESKTFNYLNNLNHGVETGAAWRFLPHTALVYDGIVDLQNYREEDPFATRSPIVFADGRRLRARLGLNGAITSRLGVRVLAGYAAIALNNGGHGQILDDHETAIGEAALTYEFGEARTSRFEIGYQRDLLLSALGGWTLWDRGFMTTRMLLGGAFLLSLEAGVAHLGYGAMWAYDRDRSMAPVPTGTNGETERRDLRVDGAVRGEYRVTSWLSFMADVSVHAVITDFEYAVYSTTAAPFPDPADYYAIIAFGGVRAHY